MSATDSVPVRGRTSSPETLRRKKTPRRVLVLRGLVAAYALAMLALWGLTHSIAENWWLGTVLTYSPRVLWILPPLVFGLVGLWKDPWSTGGAVMVALGIAGPIMDLRLPLARIFTGAVSAGENQRNLRIASCNVQGFRPRFESVVAEIWRFQPDVIAFQEANEPSDKLIAETWPDWHRLQTERLLVVSRWPLELVAESLCPNFERTQGQMVRIQADMGEFLLLNLHQMTARRGLNALKNSWMDVVRAGGEIEFHETLRANSAQVLRLHLEAVREGTPVIVVGDFNTPSTGAQYQEVWGDFANAFDRVGVGYGFTSPCSRMSWWQENTPWLRIDHVLASPEWEIMACEIGQGNGSDHRPIFAALNLNSEVFSLENLRPLENLGEETVSGPAPKY